MWSAFNDRYRLVLCDRYHRGNPVPEQVIRKLAAKCEPPTWTEGHGLIFSEGYDR
jgi:hypothetical protein